MAANQKLTYITFSAPINGVLYYLTFDQIPLIFYKKACVLLSGVSILTNGRSLYAGFL